ncbi:hypothetical protein [Roseobacter ponti]|uniref:hypothetical protein n=1 Tax=Roseobacter ponti TaxID=1891787 RepID=UPI00146F30EC|nr:hypothetical protein [Roseobacter ponti]
MADKSPRKGPAKTTGTREDRLKAALRANLARRKSQVRERQAADGTGKPATPGQKKDV